MKLRALALLGLAAALATPSCLGAGDFHCTTHADCGDGSFCEIDGRCSVNDRACTSGRRYRAREGAASGTCVGMTCAENPLRTMAAGASHACLLREDGSVACWGRNEDGELGDGTTMPSSSPVTVDLEGKKAIAIATGESHSCAALENGVVECWGAGDAGQLGGVTSTMTGKPVVVPGVANAVSLAAGAAFTCAALGDGTVSCWGDNSMGQLGDGGAATSKRAATPVFALDGVHALSAHWQHACALRDDETLWCWGDNTFGQLGDGTLANVRTRPVRAVGIDAVTDVATGRGHTCAATRAEGLFCWGYDNVGQLGRDSSVPIPTPTPVPLVTNPVAVAAGAQHTCAIRQTGETLCWGGNTSGQLGDGSLSTVPIPVTVMDLPPMTAIVAGGAFSCARGGDGATFCWGDDRYGELALGTATIRARPTRVVALEGATDLVAGAAHVCAVARDLGAEDATAKRVSCWGANQAGQLGDASTDDHARATPIKGGLDAARLGAGRAHTCAVTSDGALWCWGRGGQGQLGPTRNVDTPQPTLVSLGDGVLASAVVGGDAHTCVATTAHDARCFGANADGELGDGTMTDRATPAPVLDTDGKTPLAMVSGIAAGAAHACAIAGGVLRCWGAGADGELGDDAAKMSALPVTAKIESATSVVAGAAHTCALDASGGAWCWGLGANGQLGLGDTKDQAAPVVLGGLHARALAAGRAHTCAITTDGGVVCWGENAVGELGDGTTTDRTAPVTVDLANAEQLAAGDEHTCARLTDGTVWCWGADFDGQLGDDAVLVRSTPQLARLACH